MQPTELSDLVMLANEFLLIPDDRPEWLKNLPSARDEDMTQFGRYYRFFWEFVKRQQPETVLEVGTYYGSSIAHFAAAGNKPSCVTIDINLEAARHVSAFGLKNIMTLIGNSSDMVKMSAHLHWQYDVLFIDAFHDFKNCYQEYLNYRPLLREGGIIFFDDVAMDAEMKLAFELVGDPKVELPTLHWTGFGAAKVDPRAKVLDWAEAEAIYNSRIVKK